MEEQYNKFELLAIRLDARYGNIYEFNLPDGGIAGYDSQEWTDELHDAVRNYLLHELPVAVGDRLLSADGVANDAVTKTAQVDALLEQQPWEVALDVRNAAVAAVPTLRQLIDDFEAWPSEDERCDAETWLHAHGERVIWSEIVRSGKHFDLISVRVTPWFEHPPEPYDLVHALTPQELLGAWEDVVGPAESDLTEQEWQLIVPHFGLRRVRHGAFARTSRELATKRRMLDGIRFKMAHDVRWSQVPGRYGSASSIYQGYHNYQKAGLFTRLLQALRGNSDTTRILEWLERIVNGDHTQAPPLRRPPRDA
ncbi:transposase [Nocardia brasiliensis]|uniref:transposase n=1 Tax=Nocardia brasiliensis TaxID=37326 RepID=UPI00245434F0|nr:transposase [Nocardia brasiliensis]